jgi:hypothetical protein
MWTFIIIIIVLIIVKFLYDKNQQSVQVGRQGGMANKYRILIAHLMVGHSNTSIFQETSDSISLGVSNAGGSTIFRLLQTFGKVTIRWEMNSPLFGKHNLEWDFSEYMDQEQMFERMGNDIAKYQENAIQTSPFRDKF